MPKQDLVLRTPIMNAAGMLGFSPDPKSIPGFDRLGAFITNPVSLEARKPAASRCAISFDGGLLIHSGYPNPGLREVVKKHSKRWAASSIPVVLHLMVDDPHSMEKMIQILAKVDGVSGIELSFDPETGTQEIVQIINMAVTEYPVITQLELEGMKAVLPFIGSGEVSAISMFPRRGILPVENGSKDVNWIKGRIYSSALYPQALFEMKSLQQFDIPVIFSGGITTAANIEQALNCGAYAVQLDTVLWGKGVF